jgi:hypothetical protein
MLSLKNLPTFPSTSHKKKLALSQQAVFCHFLSQGKNWLLKDGHENGNSSYVHFLFGKKAELSVN